MGSTIGTMAPEATPIVAAPVAIHEPANPSTQLAKNLEKITIAKKTSDGTKDGSMEPSGVVDTAKETMPAASAEELVVEDLKVSDDSTSEEEEDEEMQEMSPSDLLNSLDEYDSAEDSDYCPLDASIDSLEYRSTDAEDSEEDSLDSSGIDVNSPRTLRSYAAVAKESTS